MEKTRFSDLIDSLSSVATLENWVPSYDKHTDYFYWKKPRISKDATLIKVSHETHLYVTPKGKIEGVFVEYLRNNFAAHNTDYRHMTKMFTKKISEDRYTIARKSKEMTVLFDKFAESLRADIYRDAVRDKKSIDELEFIISQVVTG